MKQYIVEETVIREMPEMAEPTYESCRPRPLSEALAAYKQTLSTMPTYPRGDNGKWKVGQIISEGVDFEFTHQIPGLCNGEEYWTTVDPALCAGWEERKKRIAAIPIEPEPKKDVDENALADIISVYGWWKSENPLLWPDLLKQLEGKFIIQYKK